MRLTFGGVIEFEARIGVDFWSALARDLSVVIDDSVASACLLDVAGVENAPDARLYALNAILRFIPEPDDEEEPDTAGVSEPIGWSWVFRQAGALGLDPRPYTLRELVWMRDGMLDDRWARLAILRGDLRAVHGMTFRAEEMNAYRRKPVSKQARESMDVDRMNLHRAAIKVREQWRKEGKIKNGRHQ